MTYFETINSIPSVKPGHFIQLDVEPHGAVVIVSTSYSKYSYAEKKVGHPDDPNRVALPAMYYHEVGQQLTFTARVVEPMLRQEVEEWYWDFGDGTFMSEDPKLNIPTTHTYRYQNPGTIVHVRARAADGTLSYASMNLMLTQRLLTPT